MMLTTECHIGETDRACDSERVRSGLYYQYNSEHVPILFEHINLYNLDTHEFQAPDFYRKLGFSVFGVLEGAPRGHKRYYMSKRLEKEEGE